MIGVEVVVLGMVCVLLAGQYGSLVSCGGCANGFDEHGRPRTYMSDALFEAKQRAKDEQKEREARRLRPYDSVRAGLECIGQHREEVSGEEAGRLDRLLREVGGVDRMRFAQMDAQQDLMDLVLELVLRIKGK
jgi:hypothetical protein